MARLNYKEVLKGDVGATYEPHVTADGILYWTNNGNLENPLPVNIHGEKGEVYTPIIDEECNLSWANNGNLENPKSVNIRGKQGFHYTPQVNEDGILSWSNDGGLPNPSNFNIKDLMINEVKESRVSLDNVSFNGLEQRLKYDFENNKDSINLLSNCIVNLFDCNSSGITENSFIQGGGSIADNQIGYCISDFIEVKPYRQYIYNFNTGMFGKNKTCICFNKEKEQIDHIEGNLSEDNNYNIIKIPNNCYYVKFSYHSKNKNEIMFIRGDKAIESYLPYGVVYLNERVNFNDEQYKEIDKKFNVLNGKKLILNGDSICYGAGFKGGYGKIIAERNNMSYVNTAVSGGTITSNTHSISGQARYWICENISNMEDGDYVLLEGGVNDASTNVAMGVITDGYEDVYDKNTFCGAFEYMLKTAIEKYKGKKIGFVLVHKMTNNFNCSKSENYYHKSIKILEKWGVPYVDLNSKIPSLCFIKSLRDLYTHNSDGWHPNEEGYKKYYVDLIENFLKSL